jgi:ABC-type uncharacterized transport system ATPase subunit
MQPSKPDVARDAPIVALRGIVKRFDGLVAVDHADLDLAAGEIHAVVGENGAGKSTLMHALAGVVRPDGGTVTVRGRAVEITSVADAHRLGIAMVHQHFTLFPSLTVAENLTIGREPRWRGLVDRDAARRTVTELAERFGLGVDPDARVGDLDVGALQRVEILRALLGRAEILILDEPTAILTPQEVGDLFRVVRELARDGHAIAFVSHHLDEVLEISDRVTVLRDGRVTAHVPTARTDAAELARAMVGRDVVLAVDRPAVERGRPVLELRGIGAPGLAGIDLTVHVGEIVGAAGVAGNGQSELAEAVAGLLPIRRGTLLVDDQDVTHASVAERRAAGLAYVPDDRYRRGLAPEASIRDNLVMGRHAGRRRRGLLLDRASLARRVERLTVNFGIRARDLGAPVSTLSGGNAQRIVLARELSDPTPVTVAAQPTRGIDIAATEFVRRALLSRRSEWSGVLLISSDLDEIRALADRIVVLHAGRIVGELPASEADDVRIGLLMAGVTGRADAGG